MMNEQVITEILERVRNRFYGKYRGAVTDVDAATMRIKAKVPSVLGETASGWCMACVPYAGDGFGHAFLPEIGSGVWIEFEAGDVSYPVWTGCYWRQGEAPPDATADARAIVTKAGHKLVFDDAAGSITLTDSNDNSVKMDSSGVTLTCGGGKIVVADGKVTVNDSSLEVT